MEKKFDLTALLKACNYAKCEINITRKGNELSELCKDNLHKKLAVPNADALAFPKLSL